MLVSTAGPLTPVESRRLILSLQSQVQQQQQTAQALQVNLFNTQQQYEFALQQLREQCSQLMMQLHTLDSAHKALDNVRIDLEGQKAALTSKSELITTALETELAQRNADIQRLQNENDATKVTYETEIQRLKDDLALSNEDLANTKSSLSHLNSSFSTDNSQVREYLDKYVNPPA